MYLDQPCMLQRIHHGIPGNQHGITSGKESGIWKSKKKIKDPGNRSWMSGCFRPQKKFPDFFSHPYIGHSQGKGSFKRTTSQDLCFWEITFSIQCLKPYPPYEKKPPCHQPSIFLRPKTSTQTGRINGRYFSFTSINLDVKQDPDSQPFGCHLDKRTFENQKTSGPEIRVYSLMALLSTLSKG